MRVSILSYAVAGAALAFGAVGASPLRIVVVSSSVERIIPAGQGNGNPFFIGHAMADPGLVEAVPASRTHKLCSHMRKMKEAIENAFGLGHKTEPVPITSGLAFDGPMHILPTTMGNPNLEGPKDIEEEHVKGEVMTQPVQGWHRHRHCTKGGFFRRIHKALSALGTWEGRAVAFVLGCGIGVLLRMVFVFTVLFVRAVRSRGEHDEDQEEVVYIALPLDEQMQEEPPTYSDEKIALVVEANA